MPMEAISSTQARGLVQRVQGSSRLQGPVALPRKGQGTLSTHIYGLGSPFHDQSRANSAVCRARQKVVRRRQVAKPGEEDHGEGDSMGSDGEEEDGVEEERETGSSARAAPRMTSTAPDLASGAELRPARSEEEVDQLRAEVSRRIRQHAKEGNLQAAIEAFTEMQIGGVAPDVMAATALIDCCIRCGEIGRAERAFSSLFSAPNSAAAAAAQSRAPVAVLKPDAIVVGVMLRAYGKRNPPQWVKIQQLLSRMEAEFGLQPSAAIFNELVDICARDNEVERGMQLLERMAQSGVEPDDTTFAAVKRRRALRSHFKKLFLA